VECFVVLFQPAGLYRLFYIPMPELTDRALDAILCSARSPPASN